MAKSWLSADNISSHFRVTKDTAYTWIAEMPGPAHKIGGPWKFRASEIGDWVRADKLASEPEPLVAPRAGVTGHAYTGIDKVDQEVADDSE